MRRLSSNRLGQLLIVGVFSICSVTFAMLPEITLAELVRTSDVVFVGRTASQTSTHYRVSVAPSQVIVGAVGDRVQVCNSPQDVESRDLRTITVDYMLFARRVGDCLHPVHGRYSIVLFKKGIANTAAITGEPERQPVSALVRKVRRLVRIHDLEK